jgi:hypothetical protein
LKARLVLKFTVKIFLRPLLITFFKSIESDARKSIRNIMWSGISAVGTFRGKARSVGRSTMGLK